VGEGFRGVEGVTTGVAREPASAAGNPPSSSSDL
jgi:hypothetical protein